MIAELAVLVLAMTAPEPEPERGPEAPVRPPKTAAAGGEGYTPLPAAPQPLDPATIARGPWRGRGWVDLALGLSIPAGGTPPGYGNVLSGVGGVWAGLRLHPRVGLATGLTTFVHDAEAGEVVDANGEVVERVGLGRVTAFELVNVRVFVPASPRIEPRFDLAGSIGPYRPPFGGTRRLAGGMRVGAGADFWLGPTLTLGLEASYRLLAIRGNVGHAVQTTLGMGIHW